MTEFASGERYLNRAWSAAADGYVDEVVHSIHASRLFLDAACMRLDAAASGSHQGLRHQPSPPTDPLT